MRNKLIFGLLKLLQILPPNMHLVLEENSGLPTLQGAPISILCDNVQLFIVTTFIAGTGHHFFENLATRRKTRSTGWFDTANFIVVAEST